MPRHPIRFAAIAFLLLGIAALPGRAAPYEDAFVRVWAAHRQNPDDHEAVIAVCREAARQRDAQDQPLLGPYLSVVRTLEGWRLLQRGRTAEAVKAFEAALDPQRSTDMVVRSADALARRWLSRIDRETVAAALKTYHREEVAFPPDLAVFAAWPKDLQPPLRDRMGDPWVYRLADFRRLKTVAAQRYTLHSITIGRDTSALADALRRPYRDTPATFVRKNAAAPALAEFQIGTAPDIRSAVVQEGNRTEDIRFVALDSANRFALLSDDDFWLTALPAAGGRR